jgi:2-polyprenyl-3-methyl-5-hydroxy-6-metoxy-1,4-benzoquinol methylase
MKQKTIITLMTNCLICGNETVSVVDNQIKVTYSVCNTCHFIHKDKEYHVDKKEENRQYSLHNNSFESEGYVKIFVDLINDYIKPLGITKKVLEYGSGPGPVLKELLNRDGYDVYDFDPYFNNNLEYQDNMYELITSTEVVEHFNSPLNDFKHLSSLLETNGYLVIMTRFRTMEMPEFLKWGYRRDVTHVSFYTLKTFEVIAKKFNLKLVTTNNVNVIVFQKI